MGNYRNASPVGWYVASYLLRFIELEAKKNDDPEAMFHVWENTVIVKASSVEEAHEKVVAVAKHATDPYKGGQKGVPVKWVFEGITEILPIYEPLEDGAEIMWSNHGARKLKTIRKWSKNIEQLLDHLKGEDHT